MKMWEPQGVWDSKFFSDPSYIKKKKKNGPDVAQNI